MPWICILGTHRSGKSSLLKSSEIKLASPTQFSTTQMSPTQVIDWWINEDAILLEASGNLFFNLDQVEDSHNNWKQLLRLCKKKRVRRPFEHLILTIDCATLSDNSSTTTLLDLLTKQLQALKKMHCKCAITLIVTQSDHIVGFNDFFSHLSHHERKSSFGFEIKLSEKNQISTQLNQYFETFLNTINQQTLTRLHREQSLNKRELIQEFPIQMEQFIDSLKHFIINIPSHISTQLTSLYFTSSKTKGSTINLTESTISQSFKLEQQHCKNSRSQKPFFIHNTLAHCINQCARYRQKLSRFIMLPATIFTILGLTVAWHQAYQTNVDLILASNQINSYVQQKNMPLLQWLSQINNLRKIINTYDGSRIKAYKWIGFSQPEKIYRHSKNRYQQMLIQYFPAYLNKMLTNVIVNNKNNPIKLYFALKTYLMLIEPNHYNQQSVINWFNHQWHHAYPMQDKMIQDLNHYLLVLLNTPSINWKYSSTLIAIARDKLRSISLDKIAYIKLEDQFTNQQNLIFPPSNQITGLNLSAVKVSKLYSASVFNRVFLHDIPKLATAITDNAWVFGTATNNNRNSDITTLITLLRKDYLHHYNSQWLNIINKIKFNQPQNISELNNLTHQIVDKKSMLNQLLNIIIGNANLLKGSLENNHTLALINDLTQQKSSYIKIKKALMRLSAYLTIMTQAPNPDKSSYNLTINRIQQKKPNDPISQLFSLAAKYPQPIAQWLNTIAQGSWQLILNQSRSYLNTIWATTVLTEYNNHIKGKYPFDTTSDNDVSLLDFTHFFGPGGTIDVFFNYYLKPFVNLKKNYWSWIKPQHSDLGMSQSTLDLFIRASLIQQMFFTNNHQSASFKFNMSPIHLSQSLKIFTLNIDGQVITTTHKIHDQQLLTWPGPRSGNATIHFVSNNNSHATQMTHGVWAWFRLLQQSTVKGTHNPTQFMVDFHHNNEHALLKITANNKANPYLIDIIDKFHIPEQL